MVSTWWGHYRTWGDHISSFVMNPRAVTLLVLLCLWASGEPASLCPGLTNEAYQILLDVLQNLKIDESDIKGSCVPVYRLDLPKTYVAYHVVSTKKEFLVISAGKKTCDHDLIVQSEGTSPIKILDKAAGKNKAKCHRYYLLNGVADMVCKDTKGKTVASTFDKNTLDEILKDFTSLDAYLEDQSKALKKYFKDICKSIEEAHKGDKPPEGRSGEVITQVPLAPGATKVIVLKSAPKEVKIHYIYEKQSITGQEKTAGLKQVCGDIKGCSVKGSFGVMASSMIKTDPDRLKLELSVDAEENSFEVEIKYKDDKTDEFYFAILRSQPSKREAGYIYGHGSPFETIYYIARSYKYPRYTPFRSSNGCFIGSGALTLTHVFAYYDRMGYCRGCLYKSYYYNGIYGSCGEVAPYSDDYRLKNYALYLRHIIGTKCNSKYSVPYANMHNDNVKNFYKYRCNNKNLDFRTYTNPEVSTSFVFNHVARGRPVIVNVFKDRTTLYATVVAGRRWHFRKKYCFINRREDFAYCYPWTDYYEYHYNLNWNDGGSHSGWTSTFLYFALVFYY